MSIEPTGFDSSVQSFASNIGFDLSGLDLTVEGDNRTNIRNGFAHYSGEDPSRTPGQVSTSNRRRFAILDGRTLLYSNNNFFSGDTAEVMAAIDSVTTSGPVGPNPDPDPGTPGPVETFVISTSSNPSDGGQVNGGGTTVAGAEINLTAVPNVGYRFDGWTGEDLSPLDQLSTTLTVTQDQNVMANFVKTWNVSLLATPPQAGTVSGAGTFDDGDVATITATASPGFRFVAWGGADVADAASPSLSVTVLDALTLVAAFVETVELTVTVNNGLGGTVTGGGLVDAGLGAPISATPNEGYRFAGWSGEGIADPSAAETTVVLTAATEVTASFIRTVHLTVLSSNTLSGSVSEGGSFDEGTSVPLTATPSDGFRFTGWTGEGITDPSAATTNIALNGNTEATASFVKIWTITVSTSVPEGGSVSEGATVDQGATVALRATPNEGYRFGGWTGEGIADPSAANTGIVVSADTEAVASFIKVWTLSVASNSTEGGSVSEGGTFDEGASVPLTATPSEGYRFVGWTGEGIADPNAATISLTIGADSSVTAMFIKVWTLTVLSSDPDGGSVSDGGTVDDGASVPIRATVNDSYRLAWWEGDGITDINASETQIVVTGDQTVTAIFVKGVSLRANASLADGGTVTGAGDYDAGTVVPISAQAAEGYRFAGWEGEGIADPTAPDTMVTVSADSSITATFIKTWSLIVQVGGSTEGGTVSGNGVFDEDTQADISATAAEGYEFVGWQGAGVSDPSSPITTVLIDREQVVSAAFHIPNADGDADGIDDAWEVANGLNPENGDDATADADRDGATNLQEFLAGTDPNNAQSRLAIVAITRVDDQLSLLWNSVEERRYVIEGTNDLSSA